jgi:hypothetical protein
VFADSRIVPPQFKAVLGVVAVFLHEVAMIALRADNLDVGPRVFGFLGHELTSGNENDSELRRKWGEAATKKGETVDRPNRRIESSSRFRRLGDVLILVFPPFVPAAAAGDDSRQKTDEKQLLNRDHSKPERKKEQTTFRLFYCGKLKFKWNLNALPWCSIRHELRLTAFEIVHIAPLKVGPTDPGGSIMRHRAANGFHWPRTGQTPELFGQTRDAEGGRGWCSVCTNGIDGLWG